MPNLSAAEERVNKMLSEKPAPKKPAPLSPPSLAEQRVAQMMSQSSKQKAAQKDAAAAAAEAAAAAAAQGEKDEIDRITAAALRYQTAPLSKESTAAADTKSKKVAEASEAKTAAVQAKAKKAAAEAKETKKATADAKAKKAAVEASEAKKATAEAKKAAAEAKEAKKSAAEAKAARPATAAAAPAPVAVSSRGGAAASRGSWQTQAWQTSGTVTESEVDSEYYDPIIPDDISPTTGQPQLSVWDRMYGTPPDEVLPDFMWLSGERGSLIMDQLPFAAFTHCLFATNKRTSPYMAKSYLCIQLPDEPSTDLRRWFEESNEFLENARRAPDSRVLVHCRMGQSRSCTLVAAYIMSHYKCSLKEALLWIKRHRDTVCPNTGFFVQLQKYEKELFGFNVPSINRTEARQAGVCSISKLNGM